MLIGVLSDTHDNLPMVRKAVRFFAEAGVEALLHAGDFVAPFALKVVLTFEPPSPREGLRRPGGPVYAVFGNNDGERAGLSKLLPDLTAGARRITLGERTIVLVHDEAALADADREDADVIVVGHTHDAEVRAGKPLVVNPGECAGWIKGRCTVATLDTETLEATIHEIGV